MQPGDAGRTGDAAEAEQRDPADVLAQADGVGDPGVDRGGGQAGDGGRHDDVDVVRLEPGGVERGEQRLAREVDRDPEELVVGLAEVVQRRVALQRQREVAGADAGVAVHAVQGGDLVAGDPDRGRERGRDLGLRRSAWRGRMPWTAAIRVTGGLLSVVRGRRPDPNLAPWAPPPAAATSVADARRPRAGGPVAALLGACHPGPTVAVTVLTGLLAVVAGTGWVRGRWSWSRCWPGSSRSAGATTCSTPPATGRPPAPTSRWPPGAVPAATCAVAIAVALVACVVLSLACGPLAGAVHLVGVAMGWAHNLGAKRTAALAAAVRRRVRVAPGLRRPGRSGRVAGRRGCSAPVRCSVSRRTCSTRCPTWPTTSRPAWWGSRNGSAPPGCGCSRRCCCSAGRRSPCCVRARADAVPVVGVGRALPRCGAGGRRGRRGPAGCPFAAAVGVALLCVVLLVVRSA